MANGPRSPCGACKFLRQKCASGCIFAPYFSSDQGPARFAAIHKVFGASNVSKLLLHLPANDRCEAVVTIAYEAQARIRDPVYGCVAHIFALQQQVSYLQAQLMQAKAQLSNNNLVVDNSNMENNQWSGASMHNNNNYPSIIQPTNLPIQNYINTPISPQSSLDSIDQQQQQQQQGILHDHFGGVIIQDKTKGIIGKKRPLNEMAMGELQDIALRMMGN